MRHDTPKRLWVVFWPNGDIDTAELTSREARLYAAELRSWGQRPIRIREYVLAKPKRRAR